MRTDEKVMWHVLETEKVHTGFWWGNMRGRDHLEDDVDVEDNIKMHLQQVG
jgi:hypothetical protein